MLLCNKQHLKATFEAQFIEKLSNTEAELKKSVAYKKKRVAYFLTVSIVFSVYKQNFMAQ